MGDIANVRLYNRLGQARTVDALTTLFDLCLVVVDGLPPRQLHQLQPVVERLDRALGDGDCTFGVLAVGVGTADALDLAGPLADRVPVFADPDGSAAQALGVRGAPALVWIDTQPAVRAVVDGWDGDQWRPVLAELARKLAWTKPLVPAPGDPAPIAPHPFTVAAAPAAATRAPTRSGGPRRKEEDHDVRIAA